jgi:hypothetical protein
MSSAMNTVVHICGPSDEFLRKRYLRCPICQCITEHVTRDGGYWGYERHCCRCGDSWIDGELCPRPFKRGWRQKSIASVRRMWDRATHGPDPTYEELFGELPPSVKTVQPSL